MTPTKSIKLNFIYNVVYQLLLIILPLITSPYIARVLGSDGIGQYSYTYSIANCFGLVGMLGVSNYGSRTIATVQQDRKKCSNAFWNIWAIQLLTTTVVLLFYGVYIIFICNKEYQLISYIHILTIACSFIDINWFFFGMEKFKLTIIRNIIIKLVNVILIFTLVKNSNDVWIYTLIIVGGMFTSNLLIWPFLKVEIDFVKPSFKEISTHLGKTISLFIPVIAISLYKQIDKVMLGTISTMNEVGFYENTEKIINIPMGLIAALGTVMLPRMSYLFAQGEKGETKKYISISMEFSCFLASALAFGIAGIAKEFVPIFFGDEYILVGNLIIAITPMIFFIACANVIRTQYLIPLNYDKAYIISVWMGAIINLIINFILIPKMGAMGAVIGTNFAEATVMLYQFWFVRRKLPIKSYYINGIYYFIAGIIMFIVIRIIGTTSVSSIEKLILEILIGGVTYLFLCIPYVLRKHNIKVGDYIKSKQKQYIDYK